MRDVEGILEKEFSHGDWIVDKPTAGMAKEAYVATRRGGESLHQIRC